MHARLWLPIGLLLLPSLLLAQARTLVAETKAVWILRDGKLESDNAPFLIAYLVDSKSVTRTAVLDTRNGQSTEDNTVYTIIPGLLTHNRDAFRFRPWTQNDALFGPVVRAAGKPGADALEVLIIGPDFVRSTRTTHDYFVITDMKRRS